MGNSMEGWLDTEGPNLALLCPLIGQHTGTQGTAIGQSPAPGYTEDGASGQYDQQCRRPDMASIRRGMIHQPNSLDSVDGEPPLPFDPVPVRLDTGEEKENLGKLKRN